MLLGGHCTTYTTCTCRYLYTVPQDRRKSTIGGCYTKYPHWTSKKNAKVFTSDITEYSRIPCMWKPFHSCPRPHPSLLCITSVFSTSLYGDVCITTMPRRPPTIGMTADSLVSMKYRFRLWGVPFSPCLVLVRRRQTSSKREPFPPPLPTWLDGATTVTHSFHL